MSDERPRPLHDQTAEFDGYVNEYMHAHRNGETDRLPEIKAEIDRVAEGMAGEADWLIVDAEGFEGRGQEVRGAAARRRARELRTHLETAVANLPAELAVPPRKGKASGAHAAG